MSDIRPAATAVIVRDGTEGLEVLLMQRVNPKPDVQGVWVFPGGVFEPQDEEGGGSEELIAKRAAKRETEEESQLVIDVDALQPLSHWTTPPTEVRRWATWFFITDKFDGELKADGEEMQRAEWFTPKEALAMHGRQAMNLIPPTVVTLTELLACEDFTQAQAFYAAREVPFIEPHMAKQGVEQGVFCMTYKGDAAYENLDASTPGARNRCYLEKGAWRYEFIEA